MKTLLSIIFTLLVTLSSYGQKFTHQDTLRGNITPERNWWDVTYYHLSVDLNIKKKSITGTNLIQYKVLKANNTLQIELQAP